MYYAQQLRITVWMMCVYLLHWYVVNKCVVLCPTTFYDLTLSVGPAEPFQTIPDFGSDLKTLSVYYYDHAEQQLNHLVRCTT